MSPQEGKRDRRFDMKNRLPCVTFQSSGKCLMPVPDNKDTNERASYFQKWTHACKLTMIFGLMIKSLCPPTWTRFFMRLKLLKRQMSRPLLFVLRLKSTSSQKYLNYNHNDRFPWLPVTSQLWSLHTEKCVADIGRQPQTKSTFLPHGAGSLDTGLWTSWFGH